MVLDVIEEVKKALNEDNLQAASNLLKTIQRSSDIADPIAEALEWDDVSSVRRPLDRLMPCVWDSSYYDAAILEQNATKLRQYVVQAGLSWSPCQAVLEDAKDASRSALFLALGQELFGEDLSVLQEVVPLVRRVAALYIRSNKAAFLQHALHYREPHRRSLQRLGLDSSDEEDEDEETAWPRFERHVTAVAHGTVSAASDAFLFALATIFQVRIRVLQATPSSATTRVQIQPQYSGDEQLGTVYLGLVGPDGYATLRPTSKPLPAAPAPPREGGPASVHSLRDSDGGSQYEWGRPAVPMDFTVTINGEEYTADDFNTDNILFIPEDELCVKLQDAPDGLGYDIVKVYRNNSQEVVKSWPKVKYRVTALTAGARAAGEAEVPREGTQGLPLDVSERKFSHLLQDWPETRHSEEMVNVFEEMFRRYTVQIGLADVIDPRQQRFGLSSGGQDGGTSALSNLAQEIESTSKNLRTIRDNLRKQKLQAKRVLVIGQEGSGKSTTINALTRLCMCTDGQCAVPGLTEARTEEMRYSEGPEASGEAFERMFLPPEHPRCRQTEADLRADLEDFKDTHEVNREGDEILTTGGIDAVTAMPTTIRLKTGTDKFELQLRYCSAAKVEKVLRVAAAIAGGEEGAFDALEHESKLDDLRQERGQDFWAQQALAMLGLEQEYGESDDSALDAALFLRAKVREEGPEALQLPRRFQQWLGQRRIFSISGPDPESVCRELGELLLLHTGGYFSHWALLEPDHGVLLSIPSATRDLVLVDMPGFANLRLNEFRQSVAMRPLQTARASGAPVTLVHCLLTQRSPSGDVQQCLEDSLILEALLKAPRDNKVLLFLPLDRAIDANSPARRTPEKLRAKCEEIPHTRRKKHINWFMKMLHMQVDTWQIEEEERSRYLEDVEAQGVVDFLALDVGVNPLFAPLDQPAAPPAADPSTSAGPAPADASWTHPFRLERLADALLAQQDQVEHAANLAALKKLVDDCMRPFFELLVRYAAIGDLPEPLRQDMSRALHLPERSVKAVQDGIGGLMHNYTAGVVKAVLRPVLPGIEDPYVEDSCPAAVLERSKEPRYDRYWEKRSRKLGMDLRHGAPSETALPRLLFDQLWRGYVSCVRHRVGTSLLEKMNEPLRKVKKLVDEAVFENAAERLECTIDHLQTSRSAEEIAQVRNASKSISEIVEAKFCRQLLNLGNSSARWLEEQFEALHPKLRQHLAKPWSTDSLKEVYRQFSSNQQRKLALADPWACKLARHLLKIMEKDVRQIGHRLMMHVAEEASKIGQNIMAIHNEQSSGNIEDLENENVLRISKRYLIVCGKLLHDIWRLAGPDLAAGPDPLEPEPDDVDKWRQATLTYENELFSGLYPASLPDRLGALTPPPVTSSVLNSADSPEDDLDLTPPTAADPGPSAGSSRRRDPRAAEPLPKRGRHGASPDAGLSSQPRRADPEPFTCANCGKRSSVARRGRIPVHTGPFHCHACCRYHRRTGQMRRPPGPAPPPAPAWGAPVQQPSASAAAPRAASSAAAGAEGGAPRVPHSSAEGAAEASGRGPMEVEQEAESLRLGSLERAPVPVPPSAAALAAALGGATSSAGERRIRLSQREQQRLAARGEIISRNRKTTESVQCLFCQRSWAAGSISVNSFQTHKSRCKRISKEAEANGFAIVEYSQ